MTSARKMYGEDPEPEPQHEYSSTQLDITGRAAERIHKLAMSIPDKDLGPEGREHEVHVTVKFGLHFQTPSKRLRAALSTFGPVSLTLGKASLFQNPDADVLKLDVDSPSLHRLNDLISKLLPTHDTHPKYVPHCTIAYLKPGKGKRYAGNASLAGTSLTFDHLTFSGRRGHRESLPLTGSPTYRAR